MYMMIPLKITQITDCSLSCLLYGCYHVYGCDVIVKNPRDAQSFVAPFVPCIMNSGQSLFNHLSPHAALKHHFKSLKTDLFFHN